MAEGKSGPVTQGPLERVRASFRKQGLMRLLEARVVEAIDGDGRRTCATLLQTVSLSPVKVGK